MGHAVFSIKFCLISFNLGPPVLSEYEMKSFDLL